MLNLAFMTSNSKNKHGLKRYLPAHVKQIVRKRCGYGCIMCGTAIVEYHHFDPEFSDAKEHDPEKITLLCGTCHSKATKGILPEEQVKAADTNPWCKKNGFAKDVLFLGNGAASITMGSCVIQSYNAIVFDKRIILGFTKSSDPKEPLLLNATFSDENGNVYLKIIRNEWFVGSEDFDIQTTGKTLAIRDSKKRVVFEMELKADLGVVINKLDLKYYGFTIDVRNGQFSVTSPKGSRLNHTGIVTADIGVWLRSNKPSLVAANLNGGAAIAIH